MLKITISSDLTDSETDSGLVKLVVMTDIFFNNQQHEIKSTCFICVKQIKSGFFSNNGKPKTDLYRKLNFQSKLSSSAS